MLPRSWVMRWVTGGGTYVSVGPAEPNGPVRSPHCCGVPNFRHVASTFFSRSPADFWMASDGFGVPGRFQLSIVVFNEVRKPVIDRRIVTALMAIGPSCATA